MLVELKARFDEENNISWAQRLEDAGVHVSYGVVGLKTHAKVVLVVRREGDGIRRYVHVGTGNYNRTTARLYTDFGAVSTAAGLGADVTDLFNVLTGFAAPRPTGSWSWRRRACASVPRADRARDRARASRPAGAASSPR